MSQRNLSEEKSSHEYPAGHLNHLTTDQAKALEDLKTICQEHGYHIVSSDPNARHDDETMLRFLRARSFVPEDAFRQFKATEEWRKEQDIDNWYNTIDVDEYEATRLLYTQWTGRRDKRGTPLYVFRIGELDMKKISEAESPTGKAESYGKLSPKLRRLFATYEHLIQFVMPLCSSVPSQPFPETPVSQTSNIVDISGVGLRQFWNLKGHLQDAGALATAHYPETLGRIFIIGAPSFFPTIWNFFKRWFDPNTVSKTLILSQSEIRTTLEKYIEPCDIPRRYGGTLDWEFGDAPVLDSEILKIMNLRDGATTIPKGPIRWSASEEDGIVEAHALGTESGNQRDEVVAQVSSHVFSKNFNALNSKQSSAMSTPTDNASRDQYNQQSSNHAYSPVAVNTKGFNTAEISI